MTPLKALDILTRHHASAVTEGDTELAEAIMIAKGALAIMLFKVEDGERVLMKELEEYALERKADRTVH